jgi:4-hydroxy-tetrahydrodipicolinate synthase
MKELLTALVTPFDQNHHLDFAALESLIENQIAGGCSGIVILGTTGEAELLEPTEQLELIEAACEFVKGRVAITVGCGKSSSHETLKLAKSYMRYPIQQVMIVTPPYVKPSQEGLIKHFQLIDEASIPFIMYHHPFRTGCQPLLSTIELILNMPHCRGLKDASGSCEIMTKLAGRYAIYSGDDSLLIPHLSLGAKGIISVISNLIPESVVSIMDAFSHSPDKALNIFYSYQKLLEVIFQEPNPIGIKAALSVISKTQNTLRTPYLPAKEEFLSKLKEAIYNFDPNLIGLNPDSKSALLI